MGRKASDVVSATLVVLAALLILAGVSFAVKESFRVYQKKHGANMTVWDWIMDSEVKCPRPSPGDEGEGRK